MRRIFDDRSGAAVLALAVSMVVPAAHATTVDLGTASGYALLLGGNATFQFGDSSNQGADTINGTAAIENGGALSFGNTNNSKHYGSITTLDEGNTVTGGVGNIGVGTVSQSAAVETMITKALSDAATAAATATGDAATLSVTGNALDITNGSKTVTALTNLTENVLDITDLNLNNGSLVLDTGGHSGAKFIINVTGSFQLSNGAKIQVTGAGASAADVLFNIETPGQTVSITGGSAAIGTLLVPVSSGQTITTTGGSLTGELIAGFNNLNTSYTIASSSSRDTGSFTYTEQSYVKKTPEPGTIALFGTGLLAVGVVRRRLKSAKA